MTENKPIPTLRRDIELRLIEEDGQEYVLMHDPAGYADAPLAVTYSFFLLLQTIEEGVTPEELRNMISEQEGDAESIRVIFHQIDYLNQKGYLDSNLLRERIERIESDYAAKTERPPICDGSSYPAEAEMLKPYLDEILNFSPDIESKNKKQPKAVIIPHIDFRIGSEAHKVYSSAYKTIIKEEAELFVIIGTSHHISTDVLMFTEKNYNTPLGIVETDQELLNLIKEKSENKITIDETAHRLEHSIELQAVLLKRYMGDRPFKILPILAGSIHNYILKNSSPASDPKYLEIVNILKDAVAEYGKNTVFLASVDLAHIGRKFDDDYDAEPILDILKAEDEKLIDTLKITDEESFFNLIAKDSDKWKICGLSPIYTMLKIIDADKGNFLEYGTWNEKEAFSAVSFASMAFYK